MSVEAMKLARNFIKFNTGSSHYVIEQLDQAIAKAEKQEVKAWYYEIDGSKGISFSPDGDSGKPWQSLYTHPQQRTWVGLTEQEQGAIMESLNAYGTNLYHFANAIEAKLKEKNT